MDKLIKTISGLYGNSEAPYFVTTEHGNIVWKNPLCKDKIAFECDYDDGIKTRRITTDDTNAVADCTEISDGENKLLLWKINSLSEAVNKLGCTDIYCDLNRYFSEMDRNLSVIEDACTADRKAVISSSDRNIVSVRRSITVLKELTDSVYGKSGQDASLIFDEEIERAVREAEKYIDFPKLSLTYRSDETGSLAIRTNPRRFYIAVFTLVRTAVLLSKADVTVELSSFGKNACAAFSFEPDNKSRNAAAVSQLELFAAGLYIKNCGGSFDIFDNDGRRTYRVRLPSYDNGILSAGSVTARIDEFSEIAFLFFSDISEYILSKE